MRLPSFLGVIIILNFSSSAYSQVTPADQQEALRGLEQTQRSHQNFLKQLEEEKAQQRREKEKAKIAIPEQNNPIPQTSEEPCFTITTIEFKDATILTGRALESLTKPYIGSCLGMSGINKLMRDATNFYIQEGYVTARVAVPQQDLKSGHLTLVVIEGTIEDIILNQNTKRDQRQIAMAFPFLKGKLLNLREIEQGLDQLDRLASSHTTMELVPGSTQGSTKIVITNTITKPSRASIGYDNSGQSSTGKNKVFASAEQDNLLGLGDAWSLHYNEDTAAHNGLKNSKVYAVNASLPFGDWTFSQNLTRLEYLLTIRGANETFQSSGQTESSKSQLERVIFRNQNSKLSLNTGLGLKDVQAFTNDTATIPGTYQLSIWNIGTDYTLRALQAVWGLGVGYERGLNALGAKQDESIIASDEAHAQFNKMTIDASIYKPFTVKSAQLAWRSHLSGQYSAETLYPSEQISIGDRYTVRGFQDSSLTGDSGAYNRNELMWNLPQFTENKYINGAAGNLQPYIGFDMGTARAHIGKEADGGTGAGYLSGWTAGLRNDSEYLAFDVGYAQKIKSPAFIETKPHELYFMVSTKIGF